MWISTPEKEGVSSSSSRSTSQILMDSLSIVLSSPCPLSRNHPKTQKLASFRPFCLLSNHKRTHSAFRSPFSNRTHFSSGKKIPILLRTHFQNSLQNHLSLVQNTVLFQNLAKLCFSFTFIDLFSAFPCLASEAAASSSAEQDLGKINLEAILVSIDDFFNRYPFFVAGCTFIWLVVIPLTEEYLSKYKFIPAIDAFRKLRDDPNSRLLDIRDKKNLKILKSPNLKILNKEVVQVEFQEGDEDGFVKKVLGSFEEPSNTVLCILDSFDGNSMKVAELLFKNGFKEAYAIKGGVRGQQGWMAIQDTLLPPSVHIKRRKKKVKASEKLSTNGSIQQNEDNQGTALTPDVPVVGDHKTDNGHVGKSTESSPVVKIRSVTSSSPYPNYPDLKPPSSPTPSKPQ
ncbi:hypothetical protein L6164_000302 [Bauhinia variegata]|uniref:Uncharacterized protein n=1 Tax=Bauhinia variegata TaxID=167791 RepID=A0ACB9Q876_BAUVA|nr:hypothetical protein L6164_000302 [Bauhinia variegata]